MAAIVSATVTLEIHPEKRETPTSNWVDTGCTVTYHIQGQTLRIERPAKDFDLSIQLEEYARFIQISREYIQGRPIIGEKGASQVPCYFHRNESHMLTLTILSGRFDDVDRTAGWLYVHFDVRLERSDRNDRKKKIDSLSGHVHVKISDYLRFLDELEQEVKAL
jgi:hypothetical protein